MSSRTHLYSEQSTHHNTHHDTSQHIITHLNVLFLWCQASLSSNIFAGVPKLARQKKLHLSKSAKNQSCSQKPICVWLQKCGETKYVWKVIRIVKLHTSNNFFTLRRSFWVHSYSCWFFLQETRESWRTIRWRRETINCNSAVSSWAGVSPNVMQASEFITMQWVCIYVYEVLHTQTHTHTHH